APPGSAPRNFQAPIPAPARSQAQTPPSPARNEGISSTSHTPDFHGPDSYTPGSYNTTSFRFRLSGTLISHWLDDLRTNRVMSFFVSTNRPSTSTSIMDSISSVNAHLARLSSSNSLSNRYPV